MKFAHFSDAHLGSWSGSPEMRHFSVKAFERAVNACLDGNVDFIVIAGDLYDSPMPPYDVLSDSVRILRKCTMASVPVYVVPGSHDYSPSEKTFITVLENAGLVKNVAKMREENGTLRLEFTVDEKTGVKLAGMMGKPGGMERRLFDVLDRESAGHEPGFKIFVFHSALEDYKPGHMKSMASVPMSMLPKGFNYYAAGHVHKPSVHENIIYPGALFPTEVAELEEYEPGIHIVDAESNVRISMKLFDIATVSVNANGMTAAEAEKKLLDGVRSANAAGRLLIVKASGTLSSGAPSDVNFSVIREAGIAAGAFAVKRNFSLNSAKFEDVQSSSLSVEAIEKEMIEDCCKKSPPPAKDNSFAAALMKTLDDEKQEGETTASYESRIRENAMKLMSL